MIWKYICKYKMRYLLGIISLFLVDYLGLFIPELTGKITDGLDQKTLQYEGVLKMVLWIFLIGLCMAAIRFAWRVFIFGAARQIEYELRNDMFTHLSKLSIKYYNEHKTGDLMSHFTNDLTAVRMSIGPAVITSFDASILTIMVIIKMICYVDLKLTLIAIIPLIFILYGGIHYGKLMEKRFADKQKAFSDMTDQVQESISGIRVIKSFVQEQKEIMAFAIANKNNKDKNLRVVKLQAALIPLLDLMIGLSSALAIFYGGKLVLSGEITPGKFIAFNQYILMLVWPMMAAGDSITYFSQGIASARRINRIFEEVPDIKDSDKMDSSLSSLQGEIQLNHLTFSYQSQVPVLKDINIKVQKGETLAILGATGSGKTTLVNLLVRMYDCEEGMILLDGKDIKEYPLSVLRDQIAYVPQDNFLFSDTIQTNIAFGVRKLKELPKEKIKFHLFPTKEEIKEATTEHEFSLKESEHDTAYDDLDEVMTAAKKACIHDNIMEFPRQYKTMVGERGVTVSGGQKQRSSIARALMKDSPVLILDDALSAVDTNTEELILKHLKEDRVEKTTIIIAHRISTIQNADHILVLKDGRCEEYGTHEELLLQGGHYAALYEKQQLEKQINSEG